MATLSTMFNTDDDDDYEDDDDDSRNATIKVCSRPNLKVSRLAGLIFG